MRSKQTGEILALWSQARWHISGAGNGDQRSAWRDKPPADGTESELL